MKLKTLLLGSAAAMIAVSGARAADAVVAEPEAVEYVRVCDLYGAGFFYIPGTETCLKFDGYVRVDYTYDTDGQNVDAALDDDSTSRWDYRARFNVDARNETDYGTLRSQIRFQADGDGGGDGAVGIDRALISIAGLRFGYSDSYTTTVHGYGNPVEKYDGFYGYDQAIFLDYTFEVAGFSATLGIQDSTGGGDTVANPHVNFEYYVGAAYSSDFGTIAASYIYEDAVDDGAYKLSATITAIDNLTLKAWFVGDGGDNTNAVEGTGDYAYGFGANYQFLDTLAVRAAWTDIDQDDVGYATVGLKWDPVPGLSVRPEIAIIEDDGGQEYSLRVYRTF